MTLDLGGWLPSQWESALAAAGVSVLVISLAAVLAARKLRNSPSLRHTVLLSALAASLAAPWIAVVAMLAPAPLVALPVVAASSSGRPLRDPRDGRDESLTDPRAAELPNMDVANQMLPPLSEDRADAAHGEKAASRNSGNRRQPLKTTALAMVSRRKAVALVELIWLAGVCVFAGFALRGLRRTQRIRRRASTPTTSRHVAIAEAAAAAVGLRKSPEILESADVATPAVVGFRRPAVLLPRWAPDAISDDGLLNVLIHEFAHVRRRDQWALAAPLAARALFWPLATIHWLNRELARAREEICDNFVLAHRDAIEYGELLLRLARLAIGRRQLGEAMGILNWRGELEGRVVRMLDPRANRETESSLTAKLSLGGAFLLAAGLMCATRFVSAQAVAQAPSAPSNEANKTKPAAASAPPAAELPTVDSLGDPLPEGARLRLGTLRFHPPHGADELALSPDGNTVVTAGDQLIAWDAATGKERWRAAGNEFGLSFLGSKYGSRAIAFSSDSSQFYTPGHSNQIFIWDAARGSRKSITISREKKNQNDNVALIRGTRTRSIDVTPDGKKFALGDSEGMLVCNLQGEVLIQIANGANAPAPLDNDDRLTFFGPYSYGRFSPDGRILAVTVSDRPEEISLYEVETGRELRKLALVKKLVRLDFSPDGKQLVATERDNAVRLYDVETGQRVWSHTIELTHPRENYASAVAFSPDGKTIAACATDNRIYLLDAAAGEEAGRLTGHHWYPWALAFAADGKLLYSWGWDGAIRRWDVPSRMQLPLPAGRHATEVVTASPDGRTLAYQDDSGAVHLVDAESGRERGKLNVPGMHFSQLLFSPDGRRLAGGGGQGDEVQLVVWDVASGELLRHWKWPKGRDPHSAVEALSFTPDGRRLAAAVFRQSAAYVFDVGDDRRLAELKHMEIYGLSFSPDGNTLATAGWDSIVRFWDSESWTARREFKIPEGKDGDDLRMYAVCYSPEGGLLATAHLSGVVRVWEPEMMTLRNHFELKGRFIYGAVAFSPDGLWLATGAQIGSVELWDPLSGKNLWDRGKHGSYVYTVGFGRDSRTLVSGGDDGVGYLWDLRPPGIHAVADVAPLWDDLAGSDPVAAYYAMWTISASPDRAIALLDEKLRPVKSVVDLDRTDEGDTPEESQRKRRLMKALVDKDPEAETVAAVRRGVAILAQLGTSEAVRLLEELAAREGDVGTFAAQALKRLEVARQ